MSINWPSENHRTLDFTEKGIQYSLPFPRKLTELYQLLNDKFLPFLQALELGNKERVDIYFSMLFDDEDQFEDQNLDNVIELRKDLYSIVSHPKPYKNKAKKQSSRFVTPNEKSFLSQMQRSKHHWWELDAIAVLAPAIRADTESNQRNNLLKDPPKIFLEQGIGILIEDLALNQNLRVPDRLYEDEIAIVLKRLISFKVI